MTLRDALARCGKVKGLGGGHWAVQAALTVTIGVLDAGHVTADKDEAQMGEGEATQPQPRTSGAPGSGSGRKDPPGVFSQAQPRPAQTVAAPLQVRRGPPAPLS